MITKKIFCIILCSICCLFVSAQTTYKDVTIDRDRDNVNVVNVINYNKYPVQVKFRYKAGSKDAEWVQYEKRDKNGYVNNYVEVKPNSTLKCPVGKKIYALDLTYVDILQPTFSDKLEEYLGDFVSGYEEGYRRAANGQ